MDEKPKILYMDHGMENFQLFLSFHSEDDSDFKVFMDSAVLQTDSLAILAIANALKINPIEVLDSIIVGGEQDGERWWTPYGLKWKAGFDALEKGDNPEDKERPGGD